MKEVFLAVQKSALVAVEEDGEEALAGYAPGTVVRVKIIQPRSNPHHNFFFAFLKEVYQQWPGEHGFKPMNYQNHLRAWLLVRAGFYEEITLEPASREEAEFTVRALRLVDRAFSNGRPFWSRIIGGKIIVRWPISIAFEKIDEEDFRRVTTLVFAAIYGETGMDVDDYYERWQVKHGRLPMAPSRSTEKFDAEAKGNSFPG